MRPTAVNIKPFIWLVLLVLHVFVDVNIIMKLTFELNLCENTISVHTDFTDRDLVSTGGYGACWNSNDTINKLFKYQIQYELHQWTSIIYKFPIGSMSRYEKARYLTSVSQGSCQTSRKREKFCTVFRETSQTGFKSTISAIDYVSKCHFFLNSK